MDDVDTDDELFDIGAATVFHDSFALFLDRVRIPFGHLRQEVLERHQVLGYLVLFQAHFVGGLEDGTHTLGHEGCHDID
jgi:hypothetical protein